MMCLTCFSKEDLLVNQKNIYCNGVNGSPTRIEMPEEGKNTVAFQNQHKQMRVPYVIYADFEALVRKIHGFERGPQRRGKRFTEKTEWHEACVVFLHGCEERQLSFGMKSLKGRKCGGNVSK